VTIPTNDQSNCHGTRNIVTIDYPPTWRSNGPAGVSPTGRPRRVPPSVVTVVQFGRTTATGVTMLCVYHHRGWSHRMVSVVGPHVLLVVSSNGDRVRDNGCTGRIHGTLWSYTIDTLVVYDRHTKIPLHHGSGRVAARHTAVWSPRT